MLLIKISEAEKKSMGWKEVETFFIRCLEQNTSMLSQYFFAMANWWKYKFMDTAAAKSMLVISCQCLFWSRYLLYISLIYIDWVSWSSLHSVRSCTALFDTGDFILKNGHTQKTLILTTSPKRFIVQPYFLSFLTGVHTLLQKLLQ